MKQVSYDPRDGQVSFVGARYPVGAPQAGPRYLMDMGLRLTWVHRLAGWGSSVLLIRADAMDDQGEYLPAIQDPETASHYTGYWALTQAEEDVFCDLMAL